MTDHHTAITTPTRRLPGIVRVALAVTGIAWLTTLTAGWAHHPTIDITAYWIGVAGMVLSYLAGVHSLATERVPSAALAGLCVFGSTTAMHYWMG